MCAKWNKKYNSEIIVKRIEEITTVKPNGSVAIDAPNFTDYQDCRDILCSALEFANNISELEKQGIIFRAVLAAVGRRPLSFRSLMREISIIENQFIKRSEKSYVLATAISIKNFEKLKRFLISGNTITFSRRLPPSFQRKTFEKKLSNVVYGEYPQTYTAVRVRVKAPSESEATRQALDSIDLLRGIWNLYLNLHTHRTLSYTGKQRAFNKIVLGPLHTLHLATGRLASSSFWYDLDYVGPLDCIDLRQRWQRIRGFENNVRKALAKNPGRGRLEETLRQYTRALDERDPGNAFLKLWSVLESLIGLDPGDSYDKLIKRTVFLYPDSDFQKQLLQHLRDHRNNVAHRGRFSDNTEEGLRLLTQLKGYVEDHWRFILVNLRQFTDFKELYQFLDSPVNFDTLQRRIGLLKKAARFRKL